MQFDSAWLLCLTVWLQSKFALHSNAEFATMQSNCCIFAIMVSWVCIANSATIQFDSVWYAINFCNYAIKLSNHTVWLSNHTMLSLHCMQCWVCIAYKTEQPLQWLLSLTMQSVAEQPLYQIQLSLHCIVSWVCIANSVAEFYCMVKLLSLIAWLLSLIVWLLTLTAWLLSLSAWLLRFWLHDCRAWRRE